MELLAGGHGEADVLEVVGFAVTGVSKRAAEVGVVFVVEVVVPPDPVDRIGYRVFGVDVRSEPEPTTAMCDVGRVVVPTPYEDSPAARAACRSSSAARCFFSISSLSRA